MKTIVICSGGLDSVSLAHMVAAKRKLTGLVSFDYGQRHRKELDYAALCAKRLDVPHDIIDMRGIGAALTGSALTDDVDVPDGHYAEETMRVTVVPNRNAIMLTVAYGIAAARGDQAVATAVHGGDHFIYPDCRPEFIAAFEHMANLATKAAVEGQPLTLATPLMHLTKAEIIRMGVDLGIDYGLTVSCYQADAEGYACGLCDSCRLRRKGFDDAGIADPTRYQLKTP